MKTLKGLMLDAAWRVAYTAWRFGDWLSTKAYAACEALEAAYFKLDNDE